VETAPPTDSKVGGGPPEILSVISDGMSFSGTDELFRPKWSADLHTVFTEIK
jgi:hypothetical protein